MSYGSMIVPVFVLTERYKVVPDFIDFLVDGFFNSSENK